MPRIGKCTPGLTVQAVNRWRWALWSTGFLTLCMLMGFAVFLASLKPGVVVLQLSFSSAAFTHILQDWGPSGIALFRAHLLADYVFLVCYAAFGYLLASQTQLLADASLPTRRLLTLLMPVAAAFDAVENLLHGRLVDLQASHAESLYVLAGTAASGKWALVALYLVGMVRAVLLRRSLV